ncbi:PD-(D/E)XK nuclease family protein [bacterium]|nr:PD-(D/E)XK nuclease family protein [bacterium]
MNNFSPNMLKTYEACPRKYFYQYVEKINVPRTSLPFEKGKKIHALANYYLQGVNISRIETALTEEERKIWEILLQNPFYKKDCFKSEFTLSVKVGDYWVGGRLDAVVHDYDTYYILDYKTGAIPKNPESDYQTMVYLLSLDKYLNVYEKLSFVYIDLKNMRNHVIEFNSELKEKSTKKIIDACETIQRDTLYKCNTEGCKYCEFAKFCTIN